MADTTAAAAKPSSSVKLVLLGEAAVGKVHHSFLAPLRSQELSSTAANTVSQTPPVLPRTPLREQ